MTQAERQSQSRRKILEAAMDEFGARDFDAVTMEAICAGHGISKGMMYHYYTGKDELFLACVGHVFQSLLKHVQHDAAALGKQAAFETIKNYFAIRECYFQRHPKEKNIFENALLRTPPHLFEKIEEIRGPIEALNRQFLHRTIGKIELRENLKKENVSIYLEAMESVFWKLVEQYRREQRISDVHSLMEAAGELWDMVLLGVVRQN